MLAKAIKMILAASTTALFLALPAAAQDAAPFPPIDQNFALGEYSKRLASATDQIIGLESIIETLQKQIAVDKTAMADLKAAQTPPAAPAQP